MSNEYIEQRRVFDFLLEKYNSQQLFTREELEVHAGWPLEKTTFRTYWTKQFRPLLVQQGDRFRVSQYFKRYGTWAKFRDNIVTQNRVLSPGYEPSSYAELVIFEFFMPLRNEEHLRAALDSLFYKDFIISRLMLFDVEEISKYFPCKGGEVQAIYMERICNWISEKFVGYSVSHVNGRYKLGKLKAKQEAFEATIGGEAYLVDETTAVTKFIIPCGDSIKNHFLAETEKQGALQEGTVWEDEVKQIRWVFYHLFVQSIIEIVNGEDEIWLLESGFCHQLHVWKSARSGEEG